MADEMRKNAAAPQPGPHVAVGLIEYPPGPGGKAERGVLVYIKASVSGDENDYVTAYKAAYPQFPTKPRRTNCSARSSSRPTGRWASISLALR